MVPWGHVLGAGLLSILLCGQANAEVVGHTHDNPLTQEWVDAISSFDAEKLDHILDELPGEFDVNYTDHYGNSAIMVSLARANLNLTQRLIARGINVNLRAYDGMSAAHYAARAGNAEIMGWLIGRGIDINVTNGLGESVLMVAVASGHSELVETLLDSGADPSMTDAAGRNALIWAAISGDVAVLDALLATEENDLDFADFDGNTAVIHAAIRNHGELVERLIDSGADATRTNLAGLSASELMLAY